MWWSITGRTRNTGHNYRILSAVTVFEGGSHKQNCWCPTDTHKPIGNLHLYAPFRKVRPRQMSGRRRISRITAVRPSSVYTGRHPFRARNIAGQKHSSHTPPTESTEILFSSFSISMKDAGPDRFRRTRDCHYRRTASFWVFLPCWVCKTIWYIPAGKSATSM